MAVNSVRKPEGFFTRSASHRSNKRQDAAVASSELETEEQSRIDKFFKACWEFLRPTSEPPIDA
jgi:hypothetical protein